MVFANTAVGRPKTPHPLPLPASCQKDTLTFETIHVNEE